MPARIGINGFGRIGRLVLRAAFQDEGRDCTVVAVNDPMLDAAQAAFLAAHDSVHGPFPGSVEVDGNSLVVNGKQRVSFFTELNPSKVPWASAQVDIVVECSGKFLNTESAAGHLTGGGRDDAAPRTVVLSAPAKDEETPTLVMGVNHKTYEPGRHRVVSNASCTTNCLAPLVKVLDDAFGVETGLMCTIHAVTASQQVVDSPSKKSWRSGRCALSNIVPATTGAAVAVTKVLPSLKGKLTGSAYRVPVADVSLVDLVVRTRKPMSMQLLADAMRAAAGDGPLNGLLQVVDQPLVSSDFIGSPASAVVDLGACMVLEGDPHTAKVCAWYDNEWGYSCRMLDLAAYIHTQAAQRHASLATLGTVPRIAAARGSAREVAAQETK